MLHRQLAAPLRAAAAAACLLGSPAALANSSQFIAKHYTEALGRAPTAAEWKSAQSQLASCNKSTLKALTQAIFTSAEYNSRGYDHHEKVLTVYRAVFSREPDAGGFAYWSDYIKNSSMSSMIDFMYQAVDGGEISSATICGALGYGWRSHKPLDNSVIPAYTDGGVRTLAELETAIAQAAPNTTVYLAKRAVITLNRTLVVKAGVTLATYGDPARTHYARQARLVRGGSGPFGNGALSELDSSLVRLEPGAKLRSVWIDGQGHNLTYHRASANVAMHSGAYTAVENSRLDSTLGWTGVIAHHYGQPCRAMSVTNNLITGYANLHHYLDRDKAWWGYTDGISGNCGDFTAASNHIIDASDVGIVIFQAGMGMNQASKAIGNTIISAGVPAFAALIFEPETATKAGPSASFSGAAFTDNQFWAAPDSHFDFGVMLGSTQWHEDPSIGNGAAATGNGNAGVPTPMYVGLLADGMTNASVSSNWISRVAPLTVRTGPYLYSNTCGITGDQLAHNASGHANTPLAFTQGAHKCIGHPAQ